MAIDAEHQWKALGIAIERLDGETMDAYQAFLAYAWIQGATRDYETVSKKLNFPIATVEFWAKEHQWSDRVSQIDAQRWLHETLERERLNAEDNKKFAEANREIKEQSIATAKKMLKVANNLLNTADLAGQTVETGMVTTADGREIPTFTEITMKSKISDIPRLVDTAVKVSRLAADLPTEIIEPLQAVSQAKDLSSLSDEELEAIYRENREKYQRLSGMQSFENIG